MIEFIFCDSDDSEGRSWHLRCALDTLVLQREPRWRGSLMSQRFLKPLRRRDYFAACTGKSEEFQLQRHSLVYFYAVDCHVIWTCCLHRHAAADWICLRAGHVHWRCILHTTRTRAPFLTCACFSGGGGAVRVSKRAMKPKYSVVTSSYIMV